MVILPQDRLPSFMALLAKDYSRASYPSTEAYYHVIKDHLERAFEKARSENLQKDEVPSRTTKIIKEWFIDCAAERISGEPSNSQELSLIKSLWIILKA